MTHKIQEEAVLTVIVYYEGYKEPGEERGEVLKCPACKSLCPQAVGGTYQLPTCACVRQLGSSVNSIV